MVEKLTEIEKDFLKEMTNIAVGNASTLLSEKTGQEIMLTVPDYTIISHAKIKEYAEAPEGIAVCTFAKLKGETVGSVMLVFGSESALKMADLLQNKKTGTTKWLSEEGQKALLQMGNTVFECYLEAIAHFMDIKMQLGDVKLFSTIGDAVLDVLLARPIEGPVLAVRNELAVKDIAKANVWFLFFLRIKGALSLIKKANRE
ncbi:MAG: chemotaxis protein CheC [Candidatus Bathyarchaeota archaeon]|nr:chemotaxis protein CheC [Candidatus Bathyarchaeota archaeon]